MGNYRAPGRTLTSVSEIRAAAKENLMLYVSGEPIPAQALYHTSLRFVADQLEHGTITWVGEHA